MRGLAWWVAGVGLAAGCAEPSSDALDSAAAVEPDPTPVFTPLDESGEVVEGVELSRYVGAWYEIGTFVIPFQAACTGSTAAYAPIDERTISVRNRCLINDLDGDPFVIEGDATLENVTNTRLSVRFFGDFGAPYWVVELDGQPGEQPYDWAVVSGPAYGTLWILHRAPQMPASLLDPILDRLEARGFDLSRISWTVQPEVPFSEADVLGDGG
jgi:apolipoprotein D and lipocalin family protein